MRFEIGSKEFKELPEFDAALSLCSAKVECALISPQFSSTIV